MSARRIPLGRLVAALAAAVVFGAAMPADSPVNVPEPEGLWTGPLQSYTTKTLKGATVIDIGALDALMPEGPVLLDVGPPDRKPDGFPADRPWLPSHRSIPGAVWLPGAGLAPLSPEREAKLLARVEELTGGDKAKPVVVFCHPDCWGSWNLGKRLVTAGYGRVHWFPEGIEGWQEKHETTALKPDPAWKASEGTPVR